jgi:Kef-type K+ transport system membrane component KefB
MSNSQEYVVLVVLGLLLIAIPVVKATLDKLGVPALVGFIGLGLLSRLVDNYFPFITSELDQTVTFLAHIGIVILLFQVGLKCGTSW